MSEKPEVVTAVWSPEWKKKLEWDYSLLLNSLTGDNDKLGILNTLFLCVGPYSLPLLAQHIFDGRSIFFENIGVRADRKDDYVTLEDGLRNERQLIGKGILLRHIANVADDFLQNSNAFQNTSVSEDYEDRSVRSSEDSESGSIPNNVNSAIREMVEWIHNAYRCHGPEGGNLSKEEMGAQNVLKVDQKSGYSVLQAAIIEGDGDKVRHIIRFCLDPELRLEDYRLGANAKKYAGLTLSQLTMTFNSKEQIEVRKAIKELTETKSNMSSLQNAVCSRNVEKVIQLVSEENEAVNDPGVVGVPPLVLAAAVGNLEMVQTLIDLGADVDSRICKGTTPHSCASYHSNCNAAKHILNRGINFDSQDESGLTAIYYAVARKNTKITQLLLQRGSNLSFIVHLLQNSIHVHETKPVVENLANMNIADTHGNTPLILAAKNGYAEIVELLLKGDKSVVNAVNKNGESALLIAIKFKQEPIAHALLNCGADVNIADRDKNTVLHHAAHDQFYQLKDRFSVPTKPREGLKTISILHKINSNFHLKNEKQESPIDIAPQNKDNSIARALLSNDKSKASMASCFNAVAVAVAVVVAVAIGAEMQLQFFG